MKKIVCLLSIVTLILVGCGGHKQSTTIKVDTSSKNSVSSSTKQNSNSTTSVNTVKLCNIKGNISYKKQEKIYHMPGCSHYADTVINTEYGERWFCSEQEARDAGWRKCKEY